MNIMQIILSVIYLNLCPLNYKKLSVVIHEKQKMNFHIYMMEIILCVKFLIDKR